MIGIDAMLHRGKRHTAEGEESMKSTSGGKGIPSEWQFKNGEFLPWEMPIDCNGHSIPDNIMELLGFESYQEMNFGIEGYMHVEVYVSINVPLAYMCWLSLGQRVESVYCENLPDLLEFLRFVTPILELSIRKEEEDQREQEAWKRRSGRRFR